MGAHYIKESACIDEFAANVWPRIEIHSRIDYQKIKDTRTAQQRKAIEVYCRLLMEAFNDAGLDMRKVLTKRVDIPWNQELVKEYIWRDVQEPIVGHRKTSELTTKQVSKIYDVINNFLANQFKDDNGQAAIYVPFPSYR